MYGLLGGVVMIGVFGLFLRNRHYRSAQEAPNAYVAGMAMLPIVLASGIAIVEIDSHGWMLGVLGGLLAIALALDYWAGHSRDIADR